MKEPELEEEALRASARGHEITIERQSLGDEVPPVDRDGAVRRQQDGGACARRAGPFARQVQRRRIRPLPARATASCRRWSMSARKIRANFRTWSRRPNKLRPIAAATGGTVRRIGSGGDSDSHAALRRHARQPDLRRLRLYRHQAHRRERRRPGVGVAPLAVGFVGLLALLGSVLMGWLWEGRGGRQRRRPLGSCAPALSAPDAPDASVRRRQRAFDELAVKQALGIDRPDELELARRDALEAQRS